MGQFHPDLLNRFLAPGIDGFTECNAPDLRRRHPQARQWLANHFLNNVFREQFQGKTRQYAFNLVFRAQRAFHLYHDARLATRRYLANTKRHNPNVRRYYAAVGAWESCFINLQLFIDPLVKFNDGPTFKKKDGSREQRAYDIATVIKHWGETIRAGKQHEDDTVPMWLTNDGLNTRTLALTYVELSELIRDAAQLADLLQDPASINERVASAAKQNARSRRTSKGRSPA
jgi:hypothetical protein